MKHNELISRNLTINTTNLDYILNLELNIIFLLCFKFILIHTIITFHHYFFMDLATASFSFLIIHLIFMVFGSILSLGIM